MIKYTANENIKVRDEEFGLLFYLIKSTSLVFINSGKLLSAKALKKGGNIDELAKMSGHDKTIALENLLLKLKERGLVNAQG